MKMAATMPTVPPLSEFKLEIGPIGQHNMIAQDGGWYYDLMGWLDPDVNGWTVEAGYYDLHSEPMEQIFVLDHEHQTFDTVEGAYARLLQLVNDWKMNPHTASKTGFGDYNEEYEGYPIEYDETTGNIWADGHLCGRYDTFEEAINVAHSYIDINMFPENNPYTASNAITEDGSMAPGFGDDYVMDRNGERVEVGDHIKDGSGEEWIVAHIENGAVNLLAAKGIITVEHLNWTDIMMGYNLVAGKTAASNYTISNWDYNLWNETATINYNGREFYVQVIAQLLGGAYVTIKNDALGIDEGMAFDNGYTASYNENRDNAIDTLMEFICGYVNSFDRTAALSKKTAMLSWEDVGGGVWGAFLSPYSYEIDYDYQTPGGYHLDIVDMQASFAGKIVHSENFPTIAEAQEFSENFAMV